jgi:hypothetical protein
MFTEDTWLNARALQVADHLSAEQIQDYSRLFFYPQDLGVAVIELHKEGAELRPLRSGLSPISTQEIGDYQRQAGRVRELLDRVELGEALLLMALDQHGIRPTQEEMGRSLEGDRQWAGQCAAPPDPPSSLRKLADSRNPPT